MRKNLLVAGLAVATLIPTLAMAQETCEQRSANRAAGTVVGAVGGAILGSAVAGRHDRGTGAVVGAVGGGVVGNQLAKGSRDCAHAYGYYDNDGRWHANAVDRTAAAGYYDRNGGWVDGPPNGAYGPDGRWVPNGGAYGANASYVAPEHRDIGTRLNWMDQRIRSGRADGSLSRREANRALDTLSDIRREAMHRRHRDGAWDGRDEAIIQAKLDRLSADIRLDRRD
jgi:hypothetical protein